MSERTKGLFETINFSRGEKNGGGTIRYLEIEEGDISDQHDIQQETTEESFLVTRWVYKEPTKELHMMSGQKTQVLLTMVLGKNWPAGPFLASLFCWDSDGAGKLEKMNPRWEKTRSQKCLSLITDLLSVAGLSRDRERNFSLNQD